MKIDFPSKTVVITANGTRARALGQITSLKVFIQDMIVPVTLQIIESREETLLLGTDWLDYMKANWNFRDRTLQISYKGKTIVIGTTHHANIPPQLPTHDNNDYEDEDELLDEIEYEPESDLEEQEAYTSDLVFESDDENPAIFLSDLPNSETPEVKKEPTIGILIQEQRAKVDEILLEHKDVFVDHISKEGQTSNLGRTTVFTHSINTGNATPIKQRPYKASPDQQEFIKREIEEMSKRSIISPSMSSWSSPVVIVPKKNGKQRFCVDYRKLNTVTEKDVYPMPIVDDLLETFNSAQ